MGRRLTPTLRQCLRYVKAPPGPIWGLSNVMLSAPELHCFDTLHNTSQLEHTSTDLSRYLAQFEDSLPLWRHKQKQTWRRFREPYLPKV